MLLAIVALPTSKPVSADILVRTANRCVQISETTAAKQRKMVPHLKLVLSVLQQRKELVRDVARSQGNLQYCMSVYPVHSACTYSLQLHSLRHNDLKSYFSSMIL